MTNFSWELAFVSASLLVAVLVFLESAMVDRNGGKMPQAGQFAIVSLSTTIWTVVSCVAWYFLDFRGVMAAVPAVYPLYSLLGLIYSNYLLRNEDIPDDPLDLVLPQKYLRFCQSFALVYAGLCLAAIADGLGLIKLPI